MNKLWLVSACFCLSGLSGCTSVVTNAQQQVSVLTPTVSDAKCTLQNDLGKWQIKHTPGVAVVSRSSKNLLVTCEKDGYHKNVVSFSASINREPNAASFKYPPEIELPLRPNNLSY